MRTSTQPRTWIPVLLTAVLATASSAPAEEQDVAAGLRAANGLVYRGDGNDPDGKDRLDLYRPAGPDPAPVIVFLHGGGLIEGDKQLYEPLGKRLASEGFLAVIPNHRLSPRVSHPTHIEDVAAALAWVRQNISSHGGDPERILLTGHSAGAYLAALLVMDPRYLAAHDLDARIVRGVVPISGFFHVERLAESRPKTVWGTDRATWLDASPARYVRADLPPFLFLYAQNDTPERRQESLDLRASLESAGLSSVRTEEIADRDHRSIIVRFSTPGDPTSERVLEFARRVLR